MQKLPESRGVPVGGLAGMTGKKERFLSDSYADSAMQKEGVLRKEPDEVIKLLDANANDFRGEWLAIIDEKIVAHNEDIGIVINKVKKEHQGEKPQYLRVQKGNIAMY